MNNNENNHRINSIFQKTLNKIINSDETDERMKHIIFIETRFAKFTDMKCRWNIRHGCIDMKVSDYMDGADDRTLEELAEYLLKRIMCIYRYETGYGSLVREYLISPEFLGRARQRYFKRARGITCDYIGRHRNIEETFVRLVEKGFIDRETLWFTWTDTEGSVKTVKLNNIFRIITVDKSLDDPSLSDRGFEWIILSAIAEMKQNLRELKIDLSPVKEFRALEMHDGQEDAYEWMKSKGMCLY